MINNGVFHNVANDIGITPIHIAANMNCIGMVQLLMAHTENPNAPASEGFTPIHMAACACILR